MNSRKPLPPMQEYTVLPARLDSSREIIPAYPGQARIIGWTSFTRSQLGYQHSGAPVFAGERAAIAHLWDAHKFIVRLDSNPAESRHHSERAL